MQECVFMQESSLHTEDTLKTGPVHRRADGRPTLVEARNLVKTFGKHEAVKNVSFTIGKGEIFGLLGPNGAGKSTTINMMCATWKLLPAIPLSTGCLFAESRSK